MSEAALRASNRAFPIPRALAGRPGNRYDRYFRVIAACACVSCSPLARHESSSSNYAVAALNSGSTASLRGLSVVNAATAWASGTRGTVLRTIDGGATWSTINVPDVDSLDFRDIEAFDSLTAYVLSAGEDGRIYKTTDGGRTWQLQFRNSVKGAFFDCFDFWDVRNGIALSDPVAGRFLLVRTEDGSSWQEIPEAGRPRAGEGEAAFAASGSCLVAAGNRRAYLASGGGPEARVFASDDRGTTWTAVTTPVAAGAPSAGIFSLAFGDADTGIAMGGDYRNPSATGVVATTQDGGRHWVATGGTGYVSGAAYDGRLQVVVAVGTGGTRVSRDRGLSWVTIDSLEYNAVQLAADGTGYLVGPRGRIARLVRH